MNEKNEKNTTNNIKENGGKTTAFSVFKKLAGMYLLICVLKKDFSVFTVFISGFPFTSALISDETKSESQRMAKGIICGFFGVLVGVVFMLLTGSYRTVLWLVPAFVGITLSGMYIYFEKHMNHKSQIVAKTAMLFAMNFLCFL